MTGKYFKRPSLSGGFGLVELMISILVGLIVIAAVTSLVLATLRTDRETLQMTRLTQDLRSVMALVTRDIRRAGYWPYAIEDIGSGLSTNPHDAITFYSGAAIDEPDDGLDADCIYYSYHDDSAGSASSIDDLEIKGFRYDEDSLAIEAMTSDAGSDDSCATDSSDWQPLTDNNPSERTVEITGFSFRTVDGDPFPNAGGVMIREIVVSLEGRLADDPDVTRRIEETIRVRNDQIN